MRTAGELASFVEAQASQWRVPGCAVGVVAADDDAVVATAGVADVRAEAPVTSSTLFRLGSVTKVLTATLVMRAVDEGRLDLDDRVVDRVPGFLLADPAATAAMTIRHLLAKAEGIYDHVEGYGTDDAAVDRYVASLADVGQVAPPGELFSYANTGPIVAARALEVAYGRAFDDLLSDRLLAPLGMDATVHVADNADIDPATPQTIDGWTLATRHTYDFRYRPVAGGSGAPPALDAPRAMAACGTTLATTITDAVALASSHLPGRSRQLVSDAGLAEMAHLQVALPELNLGAGLGWLISPDRPWVLGHNGGSRPPGTFAQITLVPENGIAVVVLANAVSGAMLAEAVTSHVLGLHDVRPPEPAPKQSYPDPTACAGTYQRGHATFTVTPNADGSLELAVAPGPLGDQDPKIEGAGTYAPGPSPWFAGPGGQVSFVSLGADGYQYLHDVRAARRIS